MNIEQNVMADNIYTTERHVLCVHVEPVEVELDDDGALLISALQSALPGASGLYFNENCKSSVKFDGKKLIPPAGGWKDRKYFATLGCRSFDYPFGTYANASKQFERSVNAVQRLFGNIRVFDGNISKEPFEYQIKSQKTSLLNSDITSQLSKADSMKNLLDSISKKKIGVESSDGNLLPLEQQFVDLAAISTAKDNLIQQQREEIKNILEKLENKERTLKETCDELAQIQSQCSAQDEELSVLRNLGKEHTYMCDKINELTKRLLANDETIMDYKNEIDKLKNRILELECEQKISTTRIVELETEKQKDFGQLLAYTDLEKTLEQMKSENEKLENDMNAVDEKYHQLNKIYQEVVAKNSELIDRCKLLEKRDIIIKTDPPGLDNNVEINVETVNSDENDVLKAQLIARDNKIAELQRMIQSLKKELIEYDENIEGVTITKNELKRNLDLTETKIQITITK